jgi:predicted pyridoxine 5'-phosphate oxidase superfamily flavin-nucleotide-binding protein
MRQRGFHSGELAVQAQAGVSHEAQRLAGMLDQPDLDGGGHKFLSHQTFVALTGRDPDGVLWTSALVGPRGFLDAHGQVLDVQASPRAGDPLAGVVPGTAVGLVAIDFAARRRMRVNGVLARASADGLSIDVDEAFGNCPQYIQSRGVEATDGVAASLVTAEGYDGPSLLPEQETLIRSADTFFLGTTHPERGSDASHRGGPAGFVRVEQGRLWWPDYLGNNMFNSFGNLAVDPTASLLFVDFASGHTLHLAGTARVDWTPPGVPGDDGRTGRHVEFITTRVVQPATPLRLRASATIAYPRNPPITS